MDRQDERQAEHDQSTYEQGRAGCLPKQEAPVIEPAYVEFPAAAGEFPVREVVLANCRARDDRHKGRRGKSEPPIPQVPGRPGEGAATPTSHESQEGQATA